MYHFSGPSASMKPPEEFELSEPRLCLPLDSGVEAPGGDMLILCGVVTPEERESGDVWRCDEAAAAAAVSAEVAFVGDEAVVV
jgi:hypothetical protein